MAGKIFSKDFEPLALPDENILLLPEKKPYKVVYLEQIPVIPHDFGAFAVDEEKRDIKLDFLEMHKNELGHFRFILVEKLAITNWRQPLGAGRFYIKNVMPQFDQTFQTLGIDAFSQFTEFFVHEDMVPIINIKNISGSALSSSEVKFFGYRYVLEPLVTVPAVYKAVPTAGFELKK
jgi:hypothetical protein